MDIKTLSPKMLKLLISKNMTQSLLAAGAGNEEKAKKFDKIAQVISAELKSRL